MIVPPPCPLTAGPQREARAFRSGTHSLLLSLRCCLALHQFVFNHVWTVSKCLATFSKRNQTWELEELGGGAVVGMRGERG